MPTHVFCSCGRPLKVQVRRDGVIFRCEEHGIVWRFVVDSLRRDKEPEQHQEGEDRKPTKK